MRTLILFTLFISTAAFAEKEVCPGPELQDLASSLEKEFLKKEACAEVEENGEKVSKCTGILAIEDELRRLENEVAIIRGFEKIIADIQTQKDKLAEVNPRQASEVIKDFNEGLQTAYLMEELVSESNPADFVSKLSTAIKSKSPDEITRSTTVLNTFKEVCNTYGDDSLPDFCEEVRNGISDQNIIEIVQLLKQSPGTEEITAWRESLSIATTDGSPYTFAAMHDLLKDGGIDLTSSKINVTQEQLRLLKNLPDIQNKANLTYLEKIRKAKDQLEMTKIFGEMQYLTSELQNRQKFETQSSLSIIWHELKDKSLELSDEDRVSCEGAWADQEKAEKCQLALTNSVSSLGVSSPEATRLSAFLENSKNGKNHLDRLTKFETECLKIEVLNEAQKTGKLKAECLENFPATELQGKLDRIKELSDLKEGVMADNRDLFDLRNIAMEQIRYCGKISSSVGEFCSEDLGIANEVNFLSLESQKLLLKFKDETSLNTVDFICKNKQDTPLKVTACRILNRAPAEEESEDPPPTPEEPVKEVKAVESRAPKNNAVKNAWIQGGMNLAATVANGMYQRPYNPYANMGGYQGPYYYSPGYNYGMSSISDNLLMFNSAYFGSMGNYYSAPGYVPYTAYPFQGSYAHSLSNYFPSYTPLR